MAEDRQKLALVTGASRGIGAATAEALAKSGYHVILTARTVDALEGVEDRIHAADGSATIAPLDLTDMDAIARLGTAIAGRWSALDLLVLNAATLGTLTPVPHIDNKEFTRVLTLNLSAQAALLAAFDPMLRESGAAHVVGLTSSVGAVPRAYWGAYGASKAGFDTLLSAYAEETRRFGRIKVAMVDPGATRTAMRARAFPGEDPTTLKSPEVVADFIVTILAGNHESGDRLAVN
jgi:short-subunit dehydrogenase